jgi:Uma2 family endonuclease
MSASPQPIITPEMYLEMERTAEIRHEYYRGIVYEMSGGSGNHAILIAHLAASLVTAMRGKPCSVTVSDMRLRVSPEGLYTYPDAMVFCGEPQYADPRNDTLLNPIVIIEVVSRSTEAYDRGFKFQQYRLVESLMDYVLVSQAEPRIEVYSRQPQGKWLLEEYVGLDAKCRFDSLHCMIALAEVYEKVIFPPPPVPRTDED